MALRCLKCRACSLAGIRRLALWVVFSVLLLFYFHARFGLDLYERKHDPAPCFKTIRLPRVRQSEVLRAEPEVVALPVSDPLPEETSTESTKTMPPWRPLDKLPLCRKPPAANAGPIPVRQEVLSMDDLENELDFVSLGGAWRPEDCMAHHRVAILIPYRDRAEHLRILLRHLHPFLQRQQLDYSIFVIEQEAGTDFNRGILYNAGFAELIKRFPGYYQCLVLHDVDLLPEDDRIIYNCSKQPRHLSAYKSDDTYNLTYEAYTGGVLELSVDQFNATNGFSNLYFEWGAEDDDFGKRMKKRDLVFTRYPSSWGRYTMINHTQATRNTLRAHMLKYAQVRIPIDGLNTLEYELADYQQRPLFTHMRISVNERKLVEDFYEKARMLFIWVKRLVYGEKKVPAAYPPRNISSQVAGRSLANLPQMQVLVAHAAMDFMSRYPHIVTDVLTYQGFVFIKDPYGNLKYFRNVTTLVTYVRGMLEQHTDVSDT